MKSGVLTVAIVIFVVEGKENEGEEILDINSASSRIRKDLPRVPSVDLNFYLTSVIG